MLAPQAWTASVARDLAGVRRAGEGLALHQRGNAAGAIIDSNGDGREIEFEGASRDTSADPWEPAVSEGAGLLGLGGSSNLSYAYGRSQPGDTVRLDFQDRDEGVLVGESSWWVRVWESDPDEQRSPRIVTT